ncbi:MAG: MoxR family ATPase [Lachnospiraceae bacterium]|nr:MoxR family ATPase [Lachnospiraceae bacterium]
MNDYERALQIVAEVKKAIVGKDECIAISVAAILAGGHILLNDIPGVGKTTLASALAKTMSLKSNRVQFTPDVLPSDILGFSMYEKTTGQFVYQPGSILCNLFLADELNRTSPKTQSALLEAMEEGQVTVDGKSRQLPEPFFVIATQNPYGSAGTQMLPESQLDRFMVSMSLGYPELEDEIHILKGQHKEHTPQAVTTAQELLHLQSLTDQVYVHEEIYRYIGRLVHRTRNQESIDLGVSPRGAICLVKMAKALAFLRQREFVVPQDVADMALPVMGHRIQESSRARVERRSKEQLIAQILREEKPPSLKRVHQ